MIKIQNASASYAERYDRNLNSNQWKTIATGRTYKEAMERFIA